MEQTPKPMETPKPKGRTMLYAIIVIILIAVGVGVYFLTQNTSTTPAAVQLTIWDTNGACLQTASPPNCGFKDSNGNANVTISHTQTIQWVNNGGSPHTVTSCDPAHATSSNTLGCPVANAAGLQSFDSGTISANGGKWPSSPYLTLAAGTYYYYCTIHPWMHGKLTVT
jgi:plastocyanin